MEALGKRVTFVAALLLCVGADDKVSAPPPSPSPAASPTATPTSGLPPAVEAMAMMFQVVGQLSRYVTNKELSSIHNEDAILSAAASRLVTEKGIVAPDQENQFKLALVRFGQKVSGLHKVADEFDQLGSEFQLKNVLDAFNEIKKLLPPEVQAAAKIAAEKYVCPMHPDVIGKRTDVCAKCGMELDQQVRLLPFGAGSLQPQLTVRSSIVAARGVEIGRPVEARLRLTRIDGRPVLLTDLIEAHTEKIHLLIIDPSLTDYHHEHPRPTQVPGEYSFAFSPRKPGAYRAWADLRPGPMGLQEYAMTDIPSATAAEPLTNKALVTKVTVDGMHYELLLPKEPLRVGRAATGRLRIAHADGRPFTQLEPVMATFAHLVGFNEDYKTVLHIHPKGRPVLDPKERGGPELEFQIYALQPGFYRLFAQVQIGNAQKFAPFGIRVEP